MANKKILLTGGGTAGHVTPNIALLPRLKEAGFDICYMGSYDGIEKQLIEDLGIAYYGISSGKLRRYKSLKNVTDVFRVNHGIGQAKRLIKKIKPDIIFSKGGFVSVPVVIGGRANKVPIIIHESDMTPGLANKIAMRYANKICCNFPETVKYLPEGKAVLTGSPIRKELMEGDKEVARKICGFNDSLPVLMIVGGSTGAVKVNEAVRAIVPELTKRFQLVHLCGKGKMDEAYKNTPNYVQFEYISSEMKDFFALADIVVSRAGANAICELLALHKPNLLIPLSANASRGDQILNAKSFAEHGYSVVLEEENITNESLLAAIDDLYKNRDKYIKTMQESPQSNAIDIIMGLIEKLA